MMRESPILFPYYLSILLGKRWGGGGGEGVQGVSLQYCNIATKKFLFCYLPMIMASSFFLTLYEKEFGVNDLGM